MIVSPKGIMAGYSPELITGVTEPERDGLSCQKLHPYLLNSRFTLDDIVFPPYRIPDFEWKDVDLTTQLTKRITLKIPLVSSPMDTVTEHRMAILMALLGGIGVIHYNFPKIQDQMDEVCKVRRFEAGFIKAPKVLGKNATVGDVFKAAEANGFFSYPITEDGTLATPMVGIVARHDVRYRENPNESVQAVMTPKERLKVAHRRETLDPNDIRAANAIIRACNIDVLPVVDDFYKVVALVTDRDLAIDKQYPNATKDENKQLKVLVAVESRLELARERIMQAVDAGASGIVVDARNIFKDHLEIARFTRKEAPMLDNILGNLVTGEVATQVMQEVGGCVDALREGIGGGEVCTTTESLGVGDALGYAIYDIDCALQSYKDVGTIADGGIKTPHHIIGALLLGAGAVMMGSELAGLDESPGKAEYNNEERRMVKIVRGMGSQEAIRERAGANRYGVANTALADRFPEGIRKTVAYKGSGEEYVKMLFNGVRQAMHGLGYRTIDDLYQNGRAVPAKRAASKGTL